MKAINIFDSIPTNLKSEVFEDIFTLPNLRIERIISQGQSTSDDFWYDQEEGEWIIVLAGHAVLEFEHEKVVVMKKGDYLNIPAGCKHKVKWTDPDQPTIWLAIFYK
jgi:cupin 2 domain-containing protein